MAIDRDIMRRRDVPMPSPDRQGQQMPRRFSVPPQQIPKGGPMPPPGMGPFRPMPMPTPMPNPGPRRPMPMPLPSPREGSPPRPMPMPMPPPGMGPFRQMPFPDRMPRRPAMPDFMDMNPGQEGLQMFAMPAAATIDPSDYRTIIKMIEQGLDPNDYMNRGGIASLLE